MRKTAAIIACKLLYFIGKLVGRGSSLPGRVALKLCPSILTRLKLPPHIIAVTGSNGKTSTVELIVRALAAGGKKVGYNHEGANQTDGVATMLLRLATLGGRVKRDVLVIESDERYARQTFRDIKPTTVVVTNLFRDQLTRNGHHEFILDCISAAIENDMKLILNADDPFVAALAKRAKAAVWFGISGGASNEDAPAGVYFDGAFCPLCKAKMTYAFTHFSHMGGYVCGACGHTRPDPDYEITAFHDDGQGQIITVNHGMKIRLAYPGPANAYNCVAALAAAVSAGVSVQTAAAALDGYQLTGGRVISFTVSGKQGMLLISKHENSTSYNQSIAYVGRRGGEHTVVILVDSISRKYFTGETSWLWDVDFDGLRGARNIVLSGRYSRELALRFEFTSIDQGSINCVELGQLRAYLESSAPGDIYAITCFSDRDKLLKALAK